MLANYDVLRHPVPGGDIAYAWSHGPVSHPLVMIHGLGDSAILSFRDPLARGPLAHTPALLIDVPGFGESLFNIDHPATIDRFADNVADLLRTLALPPAIVFGHSMGGNVSIQLASRYPDLVTRLIVAEALLQAGQSVLAADIARFDEATFVARRYPMLVRATSLHAYRGEPAARAFLVPLRRANPIAMHRAACSLVTGAQSSLATLQTGISVPRIFIMGSRTSADTSVLTTAGIPIIRIPDAGHFMLAEQETATTYAILEAIR